MNKIKYKPMILPSGEDNLKSYIKTHRLVLLENVIESINHSVEKDLSIVEVFKFENSDFVVTLERKNFPCNIEQIYEYCIENEHYELCNKIKKINLKLNNKYEKK